MAEPTTPIESIIGYDALLDSLKKCKKGVSWKSTTGYYIHNWNTELLRMEKELKDGSYTKHKPKYFTITEPKHREIMSIHFRDRIYIRSLNDNAIYPQITKSLIPDNFACQKGKGTEKARERLKEFLQKYYRHNKTDGYYLQCDIKGYYPNMSHRYAAEVLKRYLDETAARLAQAEIDYHPGNVGFNPGEQTIQNIGIAALDKLDHYIKERLKIKYYVRYMDDFVLIHEDREYLEKCKNEIMTQLQSAEMALNPNKTYIKKINVGIQYLGYEYRVTTTGKVVALVEPKKIKRAKLKIKRMKNLVDKGKRSKHDVDVYFKCWKASLKFGNTEQLIRKLNDWYGKLWEGEKENG